MDDGRMYKEREKMWESYIANTAHFVKQMLRLEDDVEELLDALHHIHSGGEYAGRSVRIKLLLKHGRIKEE